jgi:putative sigma-54 modulation protein
MQLNISGHQLRVTDSLRSYVPTKLERLERHFDRINNMKVIVCVEKKRQKTESTIRISSGEPHAAPKNKDLYATINRLTNKVDRQLVKKKEPKHRTDVYKMKLIIDR